MSETNNKKDLLKLLGWIGALAAGTAAVATVGPALRRRALRATNILAKDHKFVSGLFWALENAPAGTARKAIFNRIRKELDIHAVAEEEIFYPAVRNLRIPVAEFEVDESFAEHKEVRDLCREIAYLDPNAVEFRLRVRELKALVSRHVQEEESAMFPLARRTMSRLELERLGTQIHERKAQLKERLAA